MTTRKPLRRRAAIPMPTSCVWRLQAVPCRDGDTARPVPGACDAVREQLSLERMKLQGQPYDVRVVACETVSRLHSVCSVTIEAVAGDTLRMVRLLLPAERMGEWEYVSACAREALLDAVRNCPPTRIFKFQ